MFVKENHYGVKVTPVTRATGKGLIFLDKKLREWFGIEDSGIDIDIDFDAVFNEHKYDWLDNM